tara:strand:+ start:526 stop:840 length:315 start_codon:yes stop_codon:yes gene_type:complete
VGQKILNFKVGDLVKIRDTVKVEAYIFRPRNFPFGKAGLIVSIEGEFYDYWRSENRSDYSYYPYQYYEDEYYWEFQQIYVVLVDGEKWWLFEEEIELYNIDEED